MILKAPSKASPSRCINFFVLLSIVWLHALSVSAQKTDYRKIYEQGKSELKNKNFDKAMELFKKATHDHQDNIYKINAAYFYAYCALKTKQYWSANHFLMKIIEKYPTWNKIGEAYYLEALMSFEKHEYTNGVRWTQKITSKFMKKDVDNMKWNFLNFPSLKDTVAEINKKIPQDTTVATILFNLIKDEGGWKNKKLIKKLKEEYGLEDLEEQRKEKEQQIAKKEEPAAIPPKDTLNVAVLLPFNLKESIKDGEVKNNLYLFDLYSGMRFAVDSMKKAGTKMRFVVYDYGKDSADFCSFIEKQELAGYDVIIGPLQNSIAPRIGKFSRATNTLIINPLSTSLKFTEYGDNVYLFRTSPETQAKQAAVFSVQNFRPKKALVITSKSAKDSISANLFQSSFDSVGGKTLGRLTLTAGTLGKLDQFFNKKTLDSTGVIFVSTKDQYLGVSIVRKLTEIDRSTPLIVPSDWIDFQSISFDQMKKQNIHFMGVDFVPMGNDTIATLTRSLKRKTNSVPSIYTYIGYDLMYHLATLTQTNAVFLAQPSFKSILPQPGIVFPGMDYRMSKDNKLFPVQRFNDTGFVEVK